MDSGNAGQTEKAKKDGSGSGEGAKRSVHLGTWKAGGSAAKTTHTRSRWAVRMESCNQASTIRTQKQPRRRRLKNQVHKGLDISMENTVPNGLGRRASPGYR